MDIAIIKKMIKNLITEHTNSVSLMNKADKYYRNQTDILYAEKDNKDSKGNPLRNADNRIPSNFHSLLVDQKVSYMFTYPPQFDLGTKESNKALEDKLGDGYAKLCKDLAIAASNFSVGWLHLWQEEGKLQFALVDSRQIVPIYSESLNKKLIAVLRVYPQYDDNGERITVYEYWTDTECYAYSVSDGRDIDEGLLEFNKFKVINIDTNTQVETNIYKHNITCDGVGVVPFIEFYNNSTKTSDLDKIKKLIDCYDKVYSGFMNDLEDIQEIIFILTNYGGTDLGQFLKELKKYKTISIEDDGVGNSNTGLQTLNIDIPVEARKEMLTTTRKAIFEHGQGVDPDPQRFGDASGEALKYLYSLLELKAGLMETEFKLSLGRFVRIICSCYGIPVNKIIQTWTRNCIKNDAELAGIAKNSVGVISNATIIKNHPWVESAEEEEKQIEEEQQKLHEKEDPFYPPLNDGDVVEE
ncbi:MAG: phage portal protein [Clostridium sp.]